MELRDSGDLLVSARAVDVDSGEVLFEAEPDRTLRTASVGKLFLLHAVLEADAAGELSLEERMTRRPSDGVEGSGLWYLLQTDTLSLYDLGALVGAVSDNLATNVLIRRVGIEAVHRSTERLGVRNSALHDVVRPDRGPFDPPTLSSGTARELSDFAGRLARRELLTPEGCDILRRWLAGGTDLSMVPAPFELDPLDHDVFDRGVRVWNKTGTISTVRADVGVVTGARRRVAYAVLTEWSDGDRRIDALDAMHEAGREIRRHVLEGREGS